MSDPFEEEQRRRREQIERVDRERLRELEAEEAKTNPLADAYSDAFQVQQATVDRAEMISLTIDQKLADEWRSKQPSWLSDITTVGQEVIGRTNYEKWFDVLRLAQTLPPVKQDERLGLPDDDDELRRMRRDWWSEEEIRAQEDIDRRYPRIGGWQAGNDQQQHQALHLEIEADRALFLGKPEPKGDEKLAAMHRVLANMHSTYQKTGNKELLVAIAEQTERYNRELAKRGKA